MDDEILIECIRKCMGTFIYDPTGKKARRYAIIEECMRRNSQDTWKFW